MYSSSNDATRGGTLFAISDGMTYGWTAPYIPYLISKESHIKTTLHEAEWLETALMSGSLVGLPITMFLVTSIGRKRSILLASFVILLSWITIALGNRMEYLFPPMYMAEIAEHKIRGLLSSIIYIMVHIGCLTVYCVGPYLPFYVTPIIGGTVVVLELLIFSTVPESPYYLLLKDKPKEARKSLEYFRSDSNVDKELKDIADAIENQKADKARFQDLFMVKSNRKGILIMAVLNSGQHLCAYTVILMNLHLILEAAGSIYIESSIAAIIYAAIMLFAATFASFQIDRFGRKALLIFSTVSTGICLLILAVYFNLKELNFNVSPVSWIPIVSVMVYAAVFKTGIGIVPIVVTAEIFPAKLKAFGMTIADGMFIGGGIVAIQLYHFLSKLAGIYVPFYIFGFWSFFVALFTIFYMPETKGKSLEEIQQMLRGKKVLV
ncbi:hypothetical protein NQ317_004340 [Molorchus minor]|uniref:Major facilitator superfamily (MFS) profile domain-containing protein n=1 Tax=Molorchus minor TaxID=1323400 RepID=A0ABQ9J341_9CUCU|nr:hypothetical protein NQ317_004340 [Molorchus minor]